MITRQYIEELKREGNGAIEELIRKYKDSGTLVKILENLGYLPKSFDGSWLPDLLKHENKSVRIWVIKTIGKLKDLDFLPLLKNTVLNDSSTDVRREAVSSIGRLRSIDTVDFLFMILDEDDPKIVIQAIRGLLVFKGNERIDNKLKSLIDHENEMINKVIYKEYFSRSKKSSLKQPHADSYPFLQNVVVNADVREVLKNILDESFHLTFTSSPF